MSMRIVRDAKIIPLQILNKNTALLQRFDKVWPKQTLITQGYYNNQYEWVPAGEPVEVYSTTMVFWQGSFLVSDRMKKFVQALGMKWEDFISQEVDGEIENIYFKLNPKYVWDGSVRPGGSPEAPDIDESMLVTKERIVQAFNEKLKVGDEFEVTVTYGGGLYNYIAEHEAGWEVTELGVVAKPINTERIREVIHESPWFYFANIKDEGDIDTIVQWQTKDLGLPDQHTARKPVKNAPACDVASTVSEWGVFALMGDTRSFEQIGDVYDETIRTVSSNLEQGEVLEYSYKMKFKYLGVDVESTIVNEIYYKDQLVEIDAVSSDINNVTTNTAIDTKFKRVIAGLKINTNVNNSLYYNGHLRVDAVAKMKRNDFAEMLAKNIDTGYSVKKSSWWEKALAIVLVIIAVAVFIFTLGSGSGVSAALIAQAAALAALTLTVGAMVLAQIGGLSAMGLVGRIGKMAEFFGYMAMIAGITAVVQNAWRVASDQLMKEALATGVTQAQAQAATSTLDIAMRVVENAVGSAINSVQNAFTSVANSMGNFVTNGPTFTMDGVTSGLKMLGQGLDFYADYEKKQLREDYEQLQRAEEELQNASNVMKNPLGAMYVMQDQVCMYDAISILDREMANLTGLGTFNQWYVERASI